MSSYDNPTSITLNSCEYTPVYLVQNNNVAQTTSYMLAAAGKDSPRPITNNLKLFYENSGNLENALFLNNSQFTTKQNLTLNPVKEQTVNNLKLAKFLVAKKEVVKKPVLKVKVAPSARSNGKTNLSFVSSVVNVEKELIAGAKPTSSVRARTLLKPHTVASKAKEKTPPLVAAAATPVTQPASFQLLKLGETYHSLDNLSEEQLRIVTKALKSSGDPHRNLKPTYDPVSNTKIVYKVVSPDDLKVVGKNKIVVKQEPKASVKKTISKVVSDQPARLKKEPQEERVTKSGRTVKPPKLPADKDSSPPKAKKKALTCFQCSGEFASAYRLQRHYEQSPSHLPSSFHSSLLQCLLAMLRTCSRQDRLQVFAQQLQALLTRLRSLLPCLLQPSPEAEPWDVGEELAGLLGLNPGTYNINIEALSCVKDEEGRCPHNQHSPQQPPPETQQTQTHEVWLPSEEDDHAGNNNANSDGNGDSEDCARIKPTTAWPVKRAWKAKAGHKEGQPPKKARLSSEPTETHIELGSDRLDQLDHLDCILLQSDNATADVLPCPSEEPAAFHSAHFDIRSSPMKPSSAVFSKFQIGPSQVDKADAFLRPLLDAVVDPPDVEPPDSLDISGLLSALSPHGPVLEQNGAELTFLDALTADCDLRSSNMDFPLDLFSFPS